MPHAIFIRKLKRHHLGMDGTLKFHRMRAAGGDTP